jgi:hypothetical protein
MSSASAFASQPTAAFGDSSSDDRSGRRRFTERRDWICRVHPRTRHRRSCRRGHDTRPHGEAEGPRSAGPGTACASVRKWPGALSMSSVAVAGSGTCRTRPSGSTTLARPTVRRPHSFPDSRNHLCPASAGPKHIPWWAYCGQYVPGQVSDLFIFVFYGYSVDTYPRCIGYVSISDTYPPRIQALAVVSVLHR